MALDDTQLVALSVELLTDPLGRGYSVMSDEQARDDLNTSYREYSFDFEIFAFEQAIREAEKFDDFLYRRQSMIQDPAFPADPDAKTFRWPAMNEFMTAFVGRTTSVDTRAHPNRIAKEGVSEYWPTLLDRCQAEGSMGAGLVAAAKALCETSVARAWELFDQQVTTFDVEQARSL